MADRKWVTDKYGDQGQYKGEICNDDGLPHGFGDMIYLDGRKYIGSWKLGRWHGKGKAVFENGDVYEGNYDNDQRHGHGQYKWNDGRKFVGMFHKQKYPDVPLKIIARYIVMSNYVYLTCISDI